MELSLRALLLVAALPIAQAAAPDDRWKRCDGQDPAARISACSDIIQSGTETPARTAVAFYNRANAYRVGKRFDLALADYGDAIKLDPMFVDALGDRGITLMALGRFADAILDLTQVMALEPKSTYAVYDRGMAYEQMGLDDLALEDFSAVIELDSTDGHKFERRGTVYFRKGAYDKALADYEQALLRDPQWAPALYGRGIVKRIKGDLAGSGADIAQAIHYQADIARQMANVGVRTK